MPLVIASDDGGSELIKTCPIKMLRGTDTWEVIELYTDCEMMHCTPESGGVADQPRKLMQAFRFIRAEVNRHEMKESNRGEKN